jgi:integrase
MVLQALCDFAGAGIDLSAYRGDYSPRKVKPRDIPPDNVIVEWHGRIKSPAWQWAYGMMAAYGLRNHEVFFCNLELLRSGDPFLEITEGKTGGRRALPLPKQWVEDFELFDAIVPDCTGKDSRALGQRMTQYFRRAGVPFPPYALRHAWALRAAVMGMPTKIASELQGHSEAVHSETYQAFLRDDQLLESWRRLES